MTQETLAMHAEISYEHLNRIENYKTTPSLFVLNQLAQSLGYDDICSFLALDSSGVLHQTAD